MTIPKSWYLMNYQILVIVQWKEGELVGNMAACRPILLTPIYFFLLTTLSTGLLLGQPMKNEWDIADSLTVRLSPSQLKTLPNNIVQYLTNHGYTIPQIWDDKTPHNFVAGSFVRKGQTDWAVLASKNRIS